MPRLTESEYNEIAAQQNRRSTAAGPTGDRALREAVGGDAYIDGLGNVIEGSRPAPKDPDAAFGNRLQSEHQVVRDWVKTDEGRQTLAEEAERRKPKARLWQGAGGKWHFRTRAGDVISYADKQALVEALIFNGRSDEEIKAEMSKFLADHPDYVADPFVWSLISERLAMEEKYLTAESLEWVWKTIKPQIDAKALRVASDVVAEIESAGERQAYFDKLTYEQAESAIHSVAKARREGLI